MKKLTGKQLRLVITLIIVVIFALSYEYIYMHFEDMTDEYKDKTELVNAQIIQRRDELDNEDKILTDTLELNSQIEEILASFPITLTKEENLLFIETMEKDLRMDISPITISDPSVFYTTKLPIRDENGNEILGADQQYMTVLQSSINVTFQTTYPKFKSVLKYIKEYPEKISVSNSTLSYDSSTGDLLAAMTITRYALTGTGKKYEEPYIGDISIGTDNIFGNPPED